MSTTTVEGVDTLTVRGAPVPPKLPIAIGRPAGRSLVYVFADAPVVCSEVNVNDVAFVIDAITLS